MGNPKVASWWVVWTILVSIALAGTMLLGTGCAGLRQKTATTLVPAFQAEMVAIRALEEADEQIQHHADTKEQVLEWRPRRDAIRHALKLLHDTLTAVGALFVLPTASVDKGTP